MRDPDVQRAHDGVLQLTGLINVVVQERDQLKFALRVLLENVEKFGFRDISVEHELARGVKLARDLLGPVCSICRSRHGTAIIHPCE